MHNRRRQKFLWIRVAILLLDKSVTLDFLYPVKACESADVRISR